MMLEIRDHSLVFTIPEVHPDANLCLNFQRTFRIPETEAYNLPPGMGKFPIHVLGPNELLVPMYQSDALWINVQSSSYPFAIKATYESLSKFVVLSKHPWIDNLDDSVPKQFVAPPLIAEPGNYGFVLEIFPMKSDTYPEEWDEAHKQRVYVHLVNSVMWGSIGNEMSTIPLMEREYVRHGYPWLTMYEEKGL